MARAKRDARRQTPRKHESKNTRVAADATSRTLPTSSERADIEIANIPPRRTTKYRVHQPAPSKSSKLPESPEEVSFLSAATANELNSRQATDGLSHLETVDTARGQTGTGKAFAPRDDGHASASVSRPGASISRRQDKYKELAPKSAFHQPVSGEKKHDVSRSARLRNKQNKKRKEQTDTRLDSLGDPITSQETSFKKHMSPPAASILRSEHERKGVVSLKRKRDAPSHVTDSKQEGSPRADKRDQMHLLSQTSTQTSGSAKDDREYNTELSPSLMARFTMYESTKLVLSRLLTQRRKQKMSAWQRRQVSRISALLDVATPPRARETHDGTPPEIRYLTGAEAANYFQPNVFYNGIIVTQGEQPSPLDTICSYLDGSYEDDLRVDVQDATLATREGGVRRSTIGEVKKRFADGNAKDAWNLLELATPMSTGYRPPFLATLECNLVNRVKYQRTDSRASRPTIAPGSTEVENWALISLAGTEAGALTEPHQDSHGYDTWITMQEGTMGFGWLAQPTDEERAAWQANPQTYTGGNWRYIILEPGQTVYFPSGTVHFVFRVPGVNTMAYGGHVLRCSQIARWARVLVTERKNPLITNEDMTESALGYLNQVERFVNNAKRQHEDAVERWGGAFACEEFLRLKKEFKMLTVLKSR